jgi:hypothetical protein
MTPESRFSASRFDELREAPSAGLLPTQ